MSSPENLLKATLNRIAARLSKTLVSAAEEMAVLRKDAPERLQKEWEVFQEEVFVEAKRIEQTTNNSNNEGYNEELSKNDENETPLAKIDRLRAKVTQLNSKIEEKY